MPVQGEGGRRGCSALPGMGQPVPNLQLPPQLRGVFAGNGLASGKEDGELGTVPHRV